MEPRKTCREKFPALGAGNGGGYIGRASLFTEYDGWVPQAGIDLDPTSPNGPILSSSRLEKLGSCPLEYFFRYVLEVKTPEEYKLDPSVWLDPIQKGTTPA